MILGRRLESVALVIALALVAAACTLTVGTERPSRPPVRATAASPVPTVTGSAAAAMKRLCEAPKVGSGSGVPPEGPTPPAIAAVEQQVESVRGLRYTAPVGVTPVTQAQIDRRLSRSFDKSYPQDFYARRSQAWGTIGVIPAGSSIRDALLRFQTGQVTGYYNSTTKRLVYIGDTELGLNEHFTLAHELTHAIDDQHFGLSRLDAIGARCDDETFEAALGAVEGDAQFWATQVVERYPSASGGGSSTGGSLAGVPPFIVKLELWPYQAGLDFIRTLDDEGGTALVNRAMRTFPVSTEQVIHPDRWPNDQPVSVDVPQLAGKLGPGWRDLDVMTVGEAWLQLMLGLRLDAATASQAATGWGGGIYRAWSDGSRTAVLLRTVWDTPQDAQEFADAMTRWIGDGTASVIGPTGSRVDALFGSDQASLDALRGAVG